MRDIRHADTIRMVDQIIQQTFAEYLLQKKQIVFKHKDILLDCARERLSSNLSIPQSGYLKNPMCDILVLKTDNGSEIIHESSYPDYKGMDISTLKSIGDYTCLEYVRIKTNHVVNRTLVYGVCDWAAPGKYQTKQLGIFASEGIYTMAVFTRLDLIVKETEAMRAGYETTAVNLIRNLKKDVLLVTSDYTKVYGSFENTPELFFTIQNVLKKDGRHFQILHNGERYTCWIFVPYNWYVIIRR